MALFGKKTAGDKGRTVVVAPVSLVEKAEVLTEKLAKAKDGEVVGLTSEEFQTLNQMRFIGPV